ncbi:MAG: YjbQ family protein [Deltaproteobacteria bacterium]|nr:YjbQ family protein [Deltaproteobacteria bacterium]
MSPASVYCDSLKINLKKGPDIRDITDQVAKLIKDSKIKEGCICATVIGSTGSVTTIEYEPGVVQDLKRAITKLAPPGETYAHEQAWHDGNGHSHVQAALLGPSISLPVRNGRLVLGTWQQVVLINHDNRSRDRMVEVTITGIT